MIQNGIIKRFPFFIIAHAHNKEKRSLLSYEKQGELVETLTFR